MAYVLTHIALIASNKMLGVDLGMRLPLLRVVVACLSHSNVIAGGSGCNGIHTVYCLNSLTRHCRREGRESDSLGHGFPAHGPGGREDSALGEERVNCLLCLVVILRTAIQHAGNDHSHTDPIPISLALVP